MFGHMKDPVEGTATLVSYVQTSNANEFDREICAQVIVQGAGLEATAVQWQPWVSNATLPLAPGYVWPVTIDRADPSHFKLDEQRQQAEVDAARTAGREQAEQLAEQLRQQQDQFDQQQHHQVQSGPTP
jgi:hypothetical protein